MTFVLLIERRLPPRICQVPDAGVRAEHVDMVSSAQRSSS
jgi:hypothetical protein